MMTLNLWRAEWLKVRKRPVNRGILGAMLAIVLVVFVALTVFALVDREDFMDEATSVMPFPSSLGTGVDLLANLGGLLVVVFVANSVGSEYGRDTWKVILPRYGNRPAFLVTKWIVGLVALLLLFTAMAVSAVVLGWLGALILGIPVGASSTGPTAEQFRNLGVMALDFIFIGTLTFFGAVVTRSTIGAAIAGILSSTILAVLGPLLSLLYAGAAIVVPTAHIENLRLGWVMPGPQAAAEQAELFNRFVPPLVSALIVVGYIVVLLGSSLYLFKRRDMAGE